PRTSTLFPYTTLFRSDPDIAVADVAVLVRVGMARVIHERPFRAVGRDAFDRHTDRRLLRLAGQRDLTGAHTRNDLAGNDLWWRVARQAPWSQLHHPALVRTTLRCPRGLRVRDVLRDHVNARTLCGQPARRNRECAEQRPDHSTHSLDRHDQRSRTLVRTCA